MPFLLRPQSMLRFLQLTVLIVLTTSTSIGQEHNHDHDHHGHTGKHNELAFGAGLALISENPQLAPTIHLHAIKGISQKFGIGVGYEIIFGEELHQSLAAMLNIRPIKFVDVNMGPGIVLPFEDEPMALLFKTEAALTFRVADHLHAGPNLDLAWSSHGFHLITGLHIGLDL